MVQRVSYGACKCGAPILYEGADYCSLACQTAAFAPVCSRCGQHPAEKESALCVACNVAEEVELCARCRIPLGPYSGDSRFVESLFLCKACADEEDAALPCPLCQTPGNHGNVCASCTGVTAGKDRPILVLDNETELITDACAAPPIVCVGFANAADYWVFHQNEARVPVEAALRSDSLLVGHNIAFDMVTICAEWPDLMPLVFAAYEEDRVTDTLLREKLINIAEATHFEGTDYSLEGVARRRCGIELKKGEWQLRFAELKPYPVAQWPEEARHYVVSDIVSTFGVYRKQQMKAHWLLDQYRQARYAFAFELMSAWGLHTDPTAVAQYRQQLETKFATIAEEMVAHGLMRRVSTRKRATGLIETKLVRTVKNVRARVEQAYNEKKRVVPRTATGLVCTDADTCEHIGDPVLEHYSDLSSTGTILSTFVPLLERGAYTPLHPFFDTLLATGRTSSSPNVQNLPTEEGVRECFVPRPGYVYIVSDYAGIELRTWAQICYSLFGQSKLREALNAGIDAHTLLASKILGISYEEAVADYAENKKGRVYLPRQASKAANFGFPGGAGYRRWRDYARSNYRVEVPEDDPSAPFDAKRCKQFWRETWTESELYADWCGTQCELANDSALLEQPFVRRFRGGLRYTEFSNSGFQGLAADLAKTAHYVVTRACYIEHGSPLFGSRVVNFVHDELVTETPDNGRAHIAAKEQERLMIEAAKPFLPDITRIECETVLARRWSKAAKPVYGPDGQLVPWDWSRAS